MPAHGAGQMLRTIGLMSGTSLDGVDAAWLETDGERIAAFGPTLTLPYDDRLRADLRRILEPGADAGPGGPPAEKRRGAADRIPRARRRRAGARGGPDRLPRPDHPAPAGASADLADRQRGGTGLADRRCGWRGISARPTWRRGAGGAARARLPRRPGAGTAEAAGGAEPRRRRERDLDRRMTGQPGGVRHRPGQRPAGRLGGAPHRRALRPRRRPGAGRGRWTRRCWIACSRTRILPGRRPSRWTGWTLPPRWRRADWTLCRRADGAATLVAFTAAAVALAPLPAPPLRWLVTGGGRHNPAIMAALRAALGVPVDPVEAVGWDGDALEAQCFGFLAAARARVCRSAFPARPACRSR